MSFGYVVNVTAVDRPGIVAGVSTVIARLQGNIESCSQTVLDGYFTLILTFTADEKYDPDDVGKLIIAERGLEDCKAIVYMASEEPRMDLGSSAGTYVVSAFGKDCSGIVSQFTRYLGSKGVNIVDLFANVTPDGEFVLVCQVKIDPELDMKNIQYDLEALGEQAGFTVRIQHNNVFVATNQIRLDR